MISIVNFSLLSLGYLLAQHRSRISFREGGARAVIESLAWERSFLDQCKMIDGMD